MARFEAEYHTELIVRHPLETVRAHFSSLDVVAAQSNEVERFEKLDAHTLHFVLEAQNLTFAQFRGEYTARYEVVEGTLEWGSPVEGQNMGQSGRATFTATPEGHTAVDYTERIFTEMAVPAILAMGLRPVVAAALRSEMEGYVKRMVEALG